MLAHVCSVAIKAIKAKRLENRDFTSSADSFIVSVEVNRNFITAHDGLSVGMDFQ